MAGSETTKLVKANCRDTDILNLCLFIQQHYSFSVCVCECARALPCSPLSFLPSLAPSLLCLASACALLPAPSLPVSTSHFLFPSVNINTGLMCTLQMPALEELTAHIVGCTHHILRYTSNPEALLPPHLVQEGAVSLALRFSPPVFLATVSELQSSAVCNFNDSS